MNLNPISPILMSAMIGLCMAAMADVAFHHQVTYRTALWAALFLGGFYVNWRDK